MHLTLIQHGKVHFGAIYALALLSVVAMYVLLNLMTDGIDVYRVASVLGCRSASLPCICSSPHSVCLRACRYCLLPMVGLAFVTIVLPTK